MKGKKVMIKITVRLFAFLFALLISGCASTRVNLVDNGTVILERLPTKIVSVSAAKVYQDGDRLLVTGSITKYTFQ